MARQLRLIVMIGPVTMKLSRHSGAVIAFLALSGAMGEEIRAPQAEQGCLYANGDGIDATEGCAKDPLQLASLMALQRARVALSLQETEIRLIGCKMGSFKTSQGSHPTKRSYLIYYPILDGPVAAYVAPLTHELSHVFQMERAGGLGKFIADYPDSKRRELGADFLTGVVFKNASFQANQDFQTNLDLIGKFREMRKNAHGTPAQRASAFRIGVYLDYGAFGNSMDKANTEFQENRYATLDQI